ncbi:MAG TPA: sigma-70 family RNA polymerase sigma factor [Prolixibacteraceae bacterium]|nr:sigma-70 family RNA polymerase sigma factor [Prolixibacteraceae bacterium]
MDSVHIQHVLNGSTEDFRYLIRKYKDLAFSVAVSVVKNEFDAEEVVQESFIKAYKNLSSLKEKSNFKTWFYRILINEAFKRFQKMKGEIFLPVKENLADIEDVADSFRGMNHDEQIQLVTESLKKIPPKECLTLQLFYLEGNSINEITNCTGWSEANIKVILHRARKHLLEVVKIRMENELTSKMS